MTLYRTLATGLGVSLLLITAAKAQDAKPPVVKAGYAIHQTADLGGHIAEQSGSTAMYDTLVNIQSGPRVLGQTLTMHAVPGDKHFPLFDSLYAFSNGFGGDPYNVISVRASKGKLYDFTGSFRRDRQYFDYDLFANPLVPGTLVGTPTAASPAYTFPQIQDSPHLYNTVRRMTDVSLTFFPVSKYTVRIAFSNNTMEGPSLSSVHGLTDALLTQNFSNATDTYTLGFDWKPLSRTVVTLQQDVTTYKGDTNYQLDTANLLLLNGATTPTPVSLGYDNVLTAPTCKNYPTSTGSTAPIVSGTPFTVNPTCTGTTGYTRSLPVRTIIPTESFRFVTANVPKLHLNGDFRYTGTTMNLPNYTETLTGLTSSTREEVYNGYSNAQRIDVGANIGAVYELSDHFVLTEQFDFSSWRQPGENTLTETTYADSTGTGTITPVYNPYSMLHPISGTGVVGAPSNAFGTLNQRIENNLVSLAWEATPRASFSLGYRYRTRYLNKYLITGSGVGVLTSVSDNYTMNFTENGGIFGVDLRPTDKLTVNGGIEVSAIDNSYVPTSPRAVQHYNVRAQYKPNGYTNIYGAYNDLERRNNQARVNHLDHTRNISFGANVAPNEHYSIEFNYAYIDVFSQTDICFLSTGTPPSDAVLLTTVPGTSCVATSGTDIAYFGTGRYHAPTQSGNIGIVLTPNKMVRTGFGYRANSTGGDTELLNPRQVPGSLESQYMTPYANLALTLAPAWIWSADWNYYGYNEQGAPVGPTAPRDFHGNVVTLGMHYEF